MSNPLAPLVLLSVATILSGSAESASAPEAVDRLVDCTQIPEARDRLACFDREVEPLARSRTGGNTQTAAAAIQTPAAATPVPAVPATAPAAPASAGRAAEQASFGAEQLLPAQRAQQPEEEKALHASITAIRKVGTSQFLLTLDNGQIWRHEDGFRGSYLGVGDAITISRGAMASYRLTRDAGDSRTWIRVVRVR